MTLNQIIFEHIDEKYAYGKYGDFKVIMMTKNRFINATKLCKIYKKDFKHWNENKNSIELILEVEKEISSAGIPADENNKSTILIKGGKNELIRGTYVHELLIPHIACWISSEFAVKVSKIVNSFIANEYINEIKDKNNKIDSLEEKLNIIIKNNDKTHKMNEELIEQNKEILKNNEELLKSNKSMEKSLNKANHKLDETLEKLDEVHEELENTNTELEDTNEKLDNTDKNLKMVAKKLDIAVEDRVVKTRSKLKNESIK
jgi:methyl-accepting chemotaxis protein